ncbi:hypothetical protein DCC81_05930 [Chitinophaga parva]|uniref:Phytase-like domain-containing protein n=1 Tax=Chitinophaga parva TaxID=2169414 RepID=A0A2T7BMU9_9BACT|nr:esterase-like activity of phytase family protein [Chitinophaga parva]PUZ29007.1 hypothetical protein DCC81_05930 [Chitinophaga parva]
MKMRCIPLFLSCCISLAASAQQKISGLRFLSEYSLPRAWKFEGTPVGGLSGIDYDSARQQYYLISDDRSARSAARFYTANILLSAKGIDTVIFTRVTTLKQAGGSTYPSFAKDASKTPDPEAIRYNPLQQQLVWTSEGERIVGGAYAVLTNPGIFIMDSTGRLQDTFALPHNLYMQSIEKGPRQNAVLEGLSFTPGYKLLFTNVEEPLYEDGPRAGLTDNKAFIRLYKFDAVTHAHTGEYAYKLQPVARPAKDPNGIQMNGVSDILAIDSNHLLVLERSFSEGRLAFTVRIFLADISKAENIIDNPSLKDKPTAHPAAKRLLLDMDKLPVYIDNIEGMTFGPKLRNGHTTLICVADNNFNFLEKPQLLLFEVLP